MAKVASTIWVVDDDDSIRWVLERALGGANFSVRCFENAEDMLDQLVLSQPDAIFSDIRMPGMDGLTLLDRVSEQYPDLPVIIMTAHSDLDSAVSTYQKGAFEYLPKPFDIDDAIELAGRAVNQRRQKRSAQKSLSDSKVPDIIGEAPAMQEVFRAIGRLARSHVTVLITGDSGTGKELVARALHRHSPRSNKPMIALNTAAIPRDLLESELFGHERGAFTGAQNQRQGRFEQADGGTLFLDEIGDMPAELQTRLLRVLADGEFYRVGGRTPVKVDVRIIAATHQDLEQRVKDGRFREDLFHRLNVIRIQIPHLHQRKEDIPQLARFFLKKSAAELDVEAKVLDKDVENFLSHLDWPGNVRQLENTCRWLTVMTPGKVIHQDDLPAQLREVREIERGKQSPCWESEFREWVEYSLKSGQTDLVNEAIPALERIMLETTLQHTRGRRQEAAKLLGWGRNTLTRKIKELGLEG